jgi:hypothetical protein
VLEIHVAKNNYDLIDVTTLRAGDFTTVRPGEFHWFNCVEDCVALEVYYPEALSEDIVRRSVGGRATVEFTVPKKSPCVKVCQLDESGEKCIGCDRTLAEIAEAGRVKIDIDSALGNIPYEGYDK